MTFTGDGENVSHQLIHIFPHNFLQVSLFCSQLVCQKNYLLIPIRGVLGCLLDVTLQDCEPLPSLRDAEPQLTQDRPAALHGIVQLCTPLLQERDPLPNTPYILPLCSKSEFNESLGHSVSGELPSWRFWFCPRAARLTVRGVLEFLLSPSRGPTSFQQICQ